jgi:transcriptional regulator with XRE-family HTH domain
VIYLLKLKESRESHTLTQEKIADLLGVSRSTYTRYEQGTRQCSYLTLAKLADILNVSIDYLLGHESDSSLPQNKDSAPLYNELQIAKELESMINYIDNKNRTEPSKYPALIKDREILRTSLLISMRLATQIAEKASTAQS